MLYSVRLSEVMLRSGWVIVRRWRRRRRVRGGQPCGAARVAGSLAGWRAVGRAVRSRGRLELVLLRLRLEVGVVESAAAARQAKVELVAASDDRLLGLLVCPIVCRVPPMLTTLSPTQTPCRSAMPPLLTFWMVRAELKSRPPCSRKPHGVPESGRVMRT
ncbi:hypothetical protein BOX15_Mlig019926g1 [Macrostomum lignano]|uniref:Uncharacterized protein n=1 Tax=Macrostomum lignano TaxID=282301 RepID=A0A267ENJ5_9PLAT|nr:hypothetical protein BOX15_Mlig019926g1 [Macrostomum lignano]